MAFSLLCALFHAALLLSLSLRFQLFSLFTLKRVAIAYHRKQLTVLLVEFSAGINDAVVWRRGGADAGNPCPWRRRYNH